MPLMVEKISEGTVIDHIKAGAGMKVLAILSDAYPLSKMAALIMNAHSRKFGRKDIVKIEGVFLDEKIANRISLVAPSATINMIRNSKVSGKRQVKMPDTLTGILKCPNPMCITNLERAETSFLRVNDRHLRCRHCERLFSPEELA
ncbi:TPA: aspartate carbamoyltransferase regulatory subunit [Candidatus Micrarchaeota archaeon]|nr:aspartate carbamoyltransferase regulatory subunit [Candidatus Micrarchaeota archaeon]HIH30659.1 aspartate carbamoyltransferase regulatory subunit [Candidatus Micrarchaeota archaeon]